MSPKPVVPRILASRDVEDVIGYYLKEDARQAALAFVDALEDAYAILSQHPAIGTSRYATELEIPGLRSWALPRFPYVIFYIERDDHIDVWRVLHGRRDIPALVEDPHPGNLRAPQETTGRLSGRALLNHLLYIMLIIGVARKG